MPYVRAKTLERIIALRTQFLEERLRETERKLSTSDLATADMERRLVRAETEAGRAAVQVETQSGRINAVHHEMAAAKIELRSENDRRFAMVEELLAAVSLRAAEDRRQVEASLKDLDERLEAAEGRMKGSIAAVQGSLDTMALTAATWSNGDSSGNGHGPAVDDETIERLKADLRGMANELARISIELRADVARAVERVKHPPVIDLTGHSARAATDER